AYSTVSQLGYMFFACGVGAYGTGIFHLMTHAFFKALLFLGAGSVIHALSDEQDLRRMGGLAGRLPWTHGVMLIATLAIAGVPPLAGFFSKDEILEKAFSSGHYGIWAVGLLTALLTAFYMFRLYILAFRGPSRLSHEAEHHLHESPRSMIAPLVVLAALSIVGGWVGLPFQQGGHLFERWLRPVMESGAVDQALAQAAGRAGHAAAGHEIGALTEWMLIVVSVLAALIGIALAFRIYLQEPTRATTLRERWAGVYRVLLNKYWVDEFYDSIVVRPVMTAGDNLWRFWDTKVVDGFVNGVAGVMEGASAVLRLFQTGYVGTYALFITVGVLLLFMHFLRH
ncbi:MAG: proton-conducting transporter membrane subunit, partial [Candidatus Eisenbacteria bacterium]